MITGGVTSVTGTGTETATVAVTARLTDGTGGAGQEAPGEVDRTGTEEETGGQAVSLFVVQRNPICSPLSPPQTEEITGGMSEETETMRATTDDEMAMTGIEKEAGIQTEIETEGTLPATTDATLKTRSAIGMSP